MNEKTSINSIYPDLWATTTGLLQGLTVMQQCVYQMMFRNVCEVSGAKLYRYCCQWIKKASLCLWCLRSGPTLQAILLQAVEKWTTRRYVSQSVKNVTKMCFYALC